MWFSYKKIFDLFWFHVCNIDQFNVNIIEIFMLYKVRVIVLLFV